MYCSECGESMTWRATNLVTNVAKYKCPACGNVQTGADETMPAKKRIPKHYYRFKNRYVVRSKGKCEYIGCYGNEETAKKVVDKMEEIGWDKSLLPSIHEQLNIKRVNRTWVCV